jgi:uncharacterized membrane protein
MVSDDAEPVGAGLDAGAGGAPAGIERPAGQGGYAHRAHELLDASTAAVGGLERQVAAGAIRAHQAEQDLLPAWLRPTKGEHRWQMGLAVGAAIALQLTLPASLAIHPRPVLPALECALLIGLVLASPGRISRHSAAIHAAALALFALISLDNAVSAGLLVHLIVAGKASNAGALLIQGASIWATNVIVFGLWYWEFDRGGPVSRANAHRKHPDLMFPQMTQPEIAPSDWEPTFFDYLYTSFTNAMAFSPTDTMPLSRWSKALFLAQSGVSLITVALVISRAVNIFK